MTTRMKNRLMAALAFLAVVGAGTAAAAMAAIEQPDHDRTAYIVEGDDPCRLR